MQEQSCSQYFNRSHRALEVTNSGPLNFTTQTHSDRAGLLHCFVEARFTP